MANPTSNFNWQMPTPTDLVTDLPADFEVFGQAVDSSMADLLGGTTGQILAKNSNTNMDFVWVTNDQGDITAVTAGTGITGGGTSGAVTVTNSMATTITTKGDLVPGTGSGTFARLAAGLNGETLIADSSQAVGLSYQANWAAGKNKIINGAFNVWQRGTSFTAAGGYTADRWTANASYPTTVTQQTFTPGAAPVAGYESQFFMRLTSQAGNLALIQYKVEDVRTLAGQTVTLSYWAKIDSAANINVYFDQNFGSGGSTQVSNINSLTTPTTTSWVRYTTSFTMPSISGKTIGTSSFLQLTFYAGIGRTLDLWGVQLEAGSVATAFQTATGTIQGETSACQRYYSVGGSDILWSGSATNGNGFYAPCYFPVTMRIAPTVTLTNTQALNFGTTGSAAIITTSGFRNVHTATATALGYYGDTFTASAEL